jgi:mono/diheme cytochrome c family protein
MKYALLTFALMLNLGSAHAAGDAEAGGKLFAKTCGGCHSIGEGARGGLVRNSTASSVDPQAPPPTTSIPMR